jgi:hypothetical protein
LEALVAIPGFDDILRATQRVALHLEMRDTYAGTDPDFAAWQVGELTNRSDGDAEWRSIIRPLVDRDVNALCQGRVGHAEEREI